MPDPVDEVSERVRGTAEGLSRLVAEAEATWRLRAARSGASDDSQLPGWRPFEDAFPTFYQFTNRPRA